LSRRTILLLGPSPIGWERGAKGEIASLSGAGEDARYFQISVPVQPGTLEFKL